MPSFDAILSNPWLGIFGLTAKSDAFHPTGFGYCAFAASALLVGCALGRVTIGKRNADIRVDRRIEPRL